jgi:tetratricopeptide (TPR) repeat protein
LIAAAALVLGPALHGIPAELPARLPQSARQWNDRGSQLAQEQKWDLAVDAFGEAIKLEPERSELLVNRAVALQRMGEWTRAEADCTAAAKLNFEDTRAYLQRAIARSELGRHEEAFADASRAVRMEPENAQCVFIRHLLASRTGRHDLGHVAGETYIGIHGWNDPWSPYVVLLNWVSLRRAGNDSGAQRTLAEALTSLAPDTWPVPVIRFLNGNLDDAALLALATDPDQVTLARYYLGVHYWLKGDLERARELLGAVANTGDPAFLQTKLAADHLKELAGTVVVPSTGSKE